jgi:hypothetical protein
MKLDKKTFELIEHGDIKKIAEFTKISKPTISMAINKKEGSRLTISAIKRYYEYLKTIK